MTSIEPDTSAAKPWPAGSVTGTGELPGSDPEAAARSIADLLPDLPYLAELPERGPTATSIGRGAALLVDVPAELDVRGWRLAARPGADVRRARSLLAQDIDVVEEVFTGYSGWFKVQVTGPLTLAASVETNRGHRALADEGARRDLAASLTEGIAAWVSDVARRLPALNLLLQIDEPLLPSVLSGAMGTASGWGRVPPISTEEVERDLRAVVASANRHAAATIVHCCSDEVPVSLIRRIGAAGVVLDASVLDAEAFDVELAEWVEAGGWLFPGPSDIAFVVGLWDRTGLEARRLQQVVLTPGCGLTALSQTDVPAAYRAAVDAGRRLRDRAEA